MIELGAPDKAASSMAQLVALDPGNQSLALIYLSNLIILSQPQQALKVADFGIQRWPESGIWQAIRASIFSGFAGDDRPFQSFCKSAGPLPQISAETNLGIAASCVQDLRARRRMLEGTAITEVVTRGPNNEPEPGLGKTPIAVFRGWIGLELGDRDEAAKDGQAVLDFVARQTPSKWNPWYLRMLSANGHLLTGDKDRAVAEVHESLKLLGSLHDRAFQSLAKNRAARILAFAGAEDEAVTLLEELSADGVLWPGTIARNPDFAIPLANNARYQALKAKLEAQMAENAKLLNVSQP